MWEKGFNVIVIRRDSCLKITVFLYFWLVKLMMSHHQPLVIF